MKRLTNISVLISGALIFACGIWFAHSAPAQFFTNPMTPLYYPNVPLGYQQITNLNAATALTVPSGALIAQICVETAAVRYRDDGVNPTASVGMPAAAGACYQYGGPQLLAGVKFIQQSAGAVLNVSYYQ